MAARCWAWYARCAALLLTLLSTTAADRANDEELPHAAAHKQIIYRYIPIDKSLLNLDRAYDDYYKTNPISENARKDYSSYKGRLDSYDQLYNKDYRLRSDYNDYHDHHTGTGDKGEVDTYSSYARGDSHHHDHDPSSSKRDAYDYSESYDYDYSHDYTPTKQPKRRYKVKKKKKKKKKGTSERVLDFAEVMIRRMWSPRDSGGGHGHSHKGSHKKKTKKSKYKWPRFVTFDGVLVFLKYLFGIGAVLGYIILVTLNAVASDGWNAIFNRRSLDTSNTELFNAEALQLLRLLDAAIARYQADDCVLCRSGRYGKADSTPAERPALRPATEADTDLQSTDPV